MEDMRNACEVSNAINFIEKDEEILSEVELDDKEKNNEHSQNAKNKSIPQDKKDDGQGFNRNVGLKGSKLSGGQKQRLAIARCVVRDPKLCNLIK